jgi:hypothetical protein
LITHSARVVGFVLLLIGCATDPVTRSETCNANHHVRAHTCHPCPAGTTNNEKDNTAGDDTTCTPQHCAEDEHVVDHACVPCGPGATRPGDDDASAQDTTCDAITCAVNEQVIGHSCVTCRTGFTNAAGDDATGEDSLCDPCPAGTRDDGSHTCVACTAGWVSEPGQSDCTICPEDTFAAENVCVPCAADLVSNEGATACDVAPAAPLLSTRDYGYLFWPTNHWHRWRQFLDIQQVQTGYYGLTFDVSRASINTLGPLTAEHSPLDALTQENSLLENLPGASVRYAVLDGESTHFAEGFYGRDRAPTNPSEVIDMGRFMQRIEIPEVTYNTEDLLGSIQLAAMPRHWVLTHRAVTQTGGRPLTLTTELSGDMVAAYPEFEWLEPNRVLTVHNGAHEGWTFIVQAREGEASIVRHNDGSLSFQNHFAQSAAGQALVQSVVALPSTAASPAQLRFWQNQQTTVGVQYAQLNRDGSAAEELTDAIWDPERGVYRVQLRNLRAVGAPGGVALDDPNNHNWYNRHRLIITNTDEEDVSIPLAFDGGGNATFYIVGGSPLLRDPQGEPVGAPIQISKNWHDGPHWYHLYSALQLAPGAHEYELTFVHSKWGEAYATQHAQLSLVGWGQNQQWDESSIGSNGESITYDPDLTLGRAMVDDVRPFLVDAGRRWRWTGNVGGADFLRYFDDQGAHQRLGRLRTHYEYTGPNLTNVIYSGISRDGAIRATIKTQLGRTDDMVRAYYHLDYEFLEEVEYRRLAMFQVAADRYSDNGFTRYAYGNGAGVVLDAEISDHRTTGYADPNQRGIALDGVTPWVMLYDNQRTGDPLPERLANVGFIVRSYRATMGEQTVTTPHININRTFNGNFSQIGFELGIPFDEAHPVIPAGSRLHAVIEYVIPPSDKGTYYGQSDYLLEMPSEHYQSTEMLRYLAFENEVVVDAITGSVRSRQPVELIAARGATAVEFRLTGGLAYLPVTIRGLARPDGWRLEQQAGEEWTRVDQSVEGNDYWQAYNRSADNSFELVFNVANRGTQTYRLVR